MAFKPMTQASRSSTTPRDPNAVFPTPKAGSRRARISLIVDLGVQPRETLYKVGDKVVPPETPGAVEVKQKSCQQVAVFADLVNDVVDYGGEIGKQQYRMMLNKTHMREVVGINFTASPPIDPKTNKIQQNKPWGFHPSSLLTKLAKATGLDHVITSMDVDELLNAQFMADIEIKKTEDKNGKVDANGDPVVYTNVNFKGASRVPTDEDDNQIEVAALRVPAKSVTFDTATKEDIKTLRRSLRDKIKLAENYAGSQMQKAIEAYEAEREETPTEESKSEAKPAAPAAKSVVKKAKVVLEDDDSEDIPF